jgi:hypothetical protein
MPVEQLQSLLLLSEEHPAMLHHMGIPAASLVRDVRKTQTLVTCAECGILMMHKH